MSKFEKLYHYIVVGILFIIFLMPLGVTFLYSISSSWGATLLPDGLSLKWYSDLFSDVRFYKALFNSLIVCVSALVLAITLTFIVVFCANYYFPWLKSVMNLVVIAPFAIPPIVSSVGLLQIYATTIGGTPYILIGSYFCMVLPFIYRSIDNAMSGVNLNELLMSNKMLGGSTIGAIIKLVVPNVKSGILVALFLSFSFLLGEFLFANILVGTRFETLQVYIYNMKEKSGHYTSAMVIAYFAIIFLATLIAGMLSSKKEE
ncbi:MAG: ABC transporter permease subunit [Campylobacteraceae bacterium]|nr:ABC transporter permease subunit [Campylobacteraceae bacterium]